MSDCIQCSKEVRPRQEALSCDICKKWQHRTCNINLSRAEYWILIKEGWEIAWKCTACTEDDDIHTSLGNIPIPDAPMAPEETFEDDLPAEPMDDEPCNIPYRPTRRSDIAEDTFEEDLQVETFDSDDDNSPRFELVAGAPTDGSTVIYTF